MQEWEYRTIQMSLETWRRMHEEYTDYVAVLADGTRVEGIEALLRRYLDEGGWDLVSIFPTGFHHFGNYSLVADTLTIIFRRKRPLA
jgi:hypothetical protein